MSWVRWGQECCRPALCPPTLWEAVDCVHGDDCPGSSVYVFDAVGGKVECCACPLNGDANFYADTDEEMHEHLLEHAHAGHHVQLALADSPHAARVREIEMELKGCDG